MMSKSAIKMLAIHSFASIACRIYPCKRGYLGSYEFSSIQRVSMPPEGALEP
jgi:hypothetical protein